MRLTITRAVKGFCSLAIQLASARRRPVVLAPGGGVEKSTSAAEESSTLIAPGGIAEPLLRTLPRCRKYDGGASGPGSVMACATGSGAGLLFSKPAIEA